jgi:predicted nucleic acid-binding protein
MIRAFVDASVLYSAIISPAGGARELLKRHVRSEIELVVSHYVLEESHFNLTAKNPDLAGAVKLLLDVLALEIAETDTTGVKAAAQYTVLKDAPVVAAAIAGDCQYLLTFDRKHLLDQPDVAAKSGLTIITPGDLLGILRDNLPG